MRHPLLALALGLIFGVGIGAVLFSSPPTAVPDGAGTTRPAAGPGSPNESRSSEALARSEAVPASFAASEEAADTQSEQQARRALSRMDVPQVQAGVQGDGMLTLEVRDLDGRPLDGVHVSLLRVQSSLSGEDPASQGPDLADEAELQRNLDRAAERWTTRRKGALFAVSDSQGRAEIAGLLRGRVYTLKAHLDDWRIRSESGLEYFEAGMHTVLLGERLLRIPVELRLADGSLAEEGLVEQKFSSESKRTWAWDRSGTQLPLRAGYHELRGIAGILPGFASSESHPAEFASSSIELRVLEDGTTDLFGSAPVQLELASSTSLAVRLGPLDPALEGLYYRLDLQPVNGAQSLDQVAFDENSPVSQQIRRGQAAWFPDLEPGGYGVALLNWRGTEFLRSPVEIQPGFNDLVLQVPAPDPRAVLFVTAEDPDGRRLRGVRLIQSKETKNSSSTGGVQFKELPDGRLRVLMDPEFVEREPGTSFFMECSHERFGALRQPLPPGTTDITFRFTEPTRLTVEFLNYQGNAAMGRLRIDLEGPIDEEGLVESGYRHAEVESLVDSNGKVHFEKVAPGRYNLKLWLIDRDSRNSSTGMGEVEVVLGEGDNFESIALPNLYDVRLRVPDVEPGTSLSLRQSDPKPIGVGSAWSRVQQDHTVEFHDLVAGPHTLSGRNLRFDGEISVPCAELTLESQAKDALQVLIADEAGQLAELGLRAGDWIIGVEGRGPLTLNELRAALREDGSLSLVVQRGDSEILLPINLAVTPLTGSLEALGGQFEAGYRP